MGGLGLKRSQMPNPATPLSALPFDDGSFDFVMCNAVIQHIDPEVVRTVVLPELARVLRPGGVLQLMFKNGRGVISIFDQDYGVDRTFRLYDEGEMIWLGGTERETPGYDLRGAFIGSEGTFGIAELLRRTAYQQRRQAGVLISSH